MVVSRVTELGVRGGFGPNPDFRHVPSPGTSVQVAQQIQRAFGEWIFATHLPPAGSSTQPIEAGYKANAWVRMRHPDYDELRQMLKELNQSTWFPVKLELRSHEDGPNAFALPGGILVLTDELVELMGGRVWAESVAGEGSSFHFEIPKTKPLAKQSESALHDQGQPQWIAGTATVVVDDDERRRRRIARVVARHEGHRRPPDAEEALP